MAHATIALRRLRAERNENRVAIAIAMKTASLRLVAAGAGNEPRRNRANRATYADGFGLQSSVVGVGGRLGTQAALAPTITYPSCAIGTASNQVLIGSFGGHCVKIVCAERSNVGGEVGGEDTAANDDVEDEEGDLYRRRLGEVTSREGV
jgi:hypothetical protein